MCCCGPKQQRMERRILLKSLINVFHKTDIFSVFNKIRNIDIMLFLLLNDKQRQLVDYIQREQIVFNNKNVTIMQNILIIIQNRNAQKHYRRL